MTVNGEDYMDGRARGQEARARCRTSRYWIESGHERMKAGSGPPPRSRGVGDDDDDGDENDIVLTMMIRKPAGAVKGDLAVGH